MRKVTVSRMRERYAQTVLTFRITYVYFKCCLTTHGENWGHVGYTVQHLYCKLCLIIILLTGVWWGNLREKDDLEDLCLDGGIILKLMFKKCGGKTWTGLIWLRIDTGGRLVWMRWWTFGLRKVRGICWLAVWTISFSRVTLRLVVVSESLLLMKELS